LLTNAYMSQFETGFGLAARHIEGQGGDALCRGIDDGDRDFSRGEAGGDEHALRSLPRRHADLSPTEGKARCAWRGDRRGLERIRL
jgi:hypothetical protein